MHQIYSSLAFQSTPKHCTAINPSHITSIYDLLQPNFDLSLISSNSVDMAKIAVSKQQTKIYNQLVFARNAKFHEILYVCLRSY